MKLQKAQKYTLALMGNSISAKRRVSTLGSGPPSNKGSQATPYRRLHSAGQRMMMTNEADASVDVALGVYWALLLAGVVVFIWRL